MAKVNSASLIPQSSEWKVETSEEAMEITRLSSSFQRVKAIMQTAENPSGETVYGWICEQGIGHVFIPYDTEKALDPEKHWFEQITPIDFS